MSEREINSLTNIPTLFPGQNERRLGKYRLTHKLGQGGMGEVWLDRDTVAEIDVALKFLPAELRDNEEEQDRLKSSFRLVEKLQHPAICRLRDLQLDPSVGFFLIMDYFDGMTLSKYRSSYIKQHGSIPLSEVVRLLTPVAAALDYAHALKIVHRDIKPANILVNPDREVRIIDFQLAWEIRATLSRVSAKPPDTSGTYPYMAPELWLGTRANASTDQYALAMVAYELLAGQFPYEAGDMSMWREIVTNPRVKLPPIDDLPPQANETLAQILGSDVDQRKRSCSDFVKALTSESNFTLESSKKDAQTPLPASKVSKSASIPKMLIVPSPDYPTISIAMTAANSGDTIRVLRGVYEESVDLKSGVKLTGEDRDRCIVKLVSGCRHVLRAAELTSGVVTGLTFTGKGVEAPEPDDSIEIDEDEDEIENPHGIAIFNSRIHIENCVASGFIGCGIRVTGPKSSVILTANVCEDNQEYGISLGEGAKGTVERNACRFNKWNGIVIADVGTSATLNGNTCDENLYGGLSFDDAAEGTAAKNSCRKNGTDGISVRGAATNAKLTSNVCDENGSTGIGFYSAAQGSADKNSCGKNTGYGIFVMAPDTAPVLTANTCDENQVCGIAFAKGAKGTAKNNVCRNNVLFGIFVCDAETAPTLIANTCEMNRSAQVSYGGGAKAR